MTSSNNIPTFNDICGTVTQALAETIINREALIAELRNQISIMTKVENGSSRMIEDQMAIIRSYEKTIGDLRKEVSSLNTQLLVSHNSHMDCDRQCKELLADYANLKKQLTLLSKDYLRVIKENENPKQDFGRGDAYWTAISQRDEARRMVCEYKADRLNSADDPAPLTPQEIARMENWDDLYADPSIRAQHVAEQSDTDPETGVQYGDLN